MIRVDANTEYHSGMAAPSGGADWSPRQGVSLLVLKRTVSTLSGSRIGSTRRIAVSGKRGGSCRSPHRWREI